MINKHVINWERTGIMTQLTVRWAFNTQQWTPTKNEILKASTIIQREEKNRISKFVYIDDAKSSLIGRLMLRKYIKIAINLTNDNIKLSRDNHGKPVLAGYEDTSPFFNVSHQGDYVVLAGDKNKCGIDVMKVEPPFNKDIKDFFRLMSRQFSPTEWSKIQSYDTEMEQIASFYRHWCLKESYVKNIGVGITVKLSDISFQTHSDLTIGNLTTDTTLTVEGSLKDSFVFEETLVDEKHALAVATEFPNKSDYVPTKFDFLEFQDLVEGVEPLCDEDETFANGFLKKGRKHF